MPADKDYRNHSTYLVLMDLVAVITSFFAAYLLRFWSGLIPAGHVPDLNEYSSALIAVLPVYLWIFRTYNLYAPRRHIRRIEEIFIVIKAVSVAIVILMAISFFYRKLTYSRIYLTVMWLTSIILVSLCRYYVIQWMYYRRLHKKDLIRILLVGVNRNARQIIKWSKANPHLGLEIVGLLSRKPSLVGRHIEDVAIIGVADQCENFIANLKPDEVILLDHLTPRDRITHLVALCEERVIDFKVGADFYGLMTRNLDVEYVSTVPLLGFRSLPLDDFLNRSAKRTLDIIVTSLILIFSAPLWVLAIILIKLDDHGPVLYAQERVGRDQNVFKVYKFRTMKVEAEKETGPVWARQNDSRRTRVGNFLRRWNIDELPQLWNVLKGEMSLVGPRPERPHFVEQFKSQIPLYMTRHKVKSGLTGWAQVNGYRGNTSLQERIKYDLYYMENWSLLFDIEIIFMTLFAFKNAY